jgi:hypothetical protein
VTDHPRRSSGRTRRRRGAGPRARARRLCAALLASVPGGWLATAVAACPVCFGEAQGPILDGARLAILFMAVLVYGLIGGGIALVFALRRRALRLQKERDPRRGLRLVHSEAEAQ